MVKNVINVFLGLLVVCFGTTSVMAVDPKKPIGTLGAVVDNAGINNLVSNAIQNSATFTTAVETAVDGKLADKMNVCAGEKCPWASKMDACEGDGCPWANAGAMTDDDIAISSDNKLKIVSCGSALANTVGSQTVYKCNVKMSSTLTIKTVEKSIASAMITKYCSNNTVGAECVEYEKCIVIGTDDTNKTSFSGITVKQTAKTVTAVKLQTACGSISSKNAACVVVSGTTYCPDGVEEFSDSDVTAGEGTLKIVANCGAALTPVIANSTVYKCNVRDNSSLTIKGVQKALLGATRTAYCKEGTKDSTCSEYAKCIVIGGGDEITLAAHQTAKTVSKVKIRMVCGDVSTVNAACVVVSGTTYCPDDVSLISSKFDGNGKLSKDYLTDDIKALPNKFDSDGKLIIGILPDKVLTEDNKDSKLTGFAKTSDIFDSNTGKLIGTKLPDSVITDSNKDDKLTGFAKLNNGKLGTDVMPAEIYDSDNKKLILPDSVITDGNKDTKLSGFAKADALKTVTDKFNDNGSLKELSNYAAKSTVNELATTFNGIYDKDTKQLKTEALPSKIYNTKTGLVLPENVVTTNNKGQLNIDVTNIVVSEGKTLEDALKNKADAANVPSKSDVTTLQGYFSDGKLDADAVPSNVATLKAGKLDADAIPELTDYAKASTVSALVTTVNGRTSTLTALNNLATMLQGKTVVIMDGNTEKVMTVPSDLSSSSSATFKTVSRETSGIILTPISK